MLAAQKPGWHAACCWSASHRDVEAVNDVRCDPRPPQGGLFLVNFVNGRYRSQIPVNL